jgi:hypothetical protein
MGLSQSEFCNVIRETLTFRTDDPDRGAMARDIQEIGKDTPEGRNFSRREVLGLIGATAAACRRPGEESALAHTQNTNSLIVRIDAKPETIAIDISKTAVIVVDMQNDLVLRVACSTCRELTFWGFERLLAPQKC